MKNILSLLVVLYTALVPAGAQTSTTLAKLRASSATDTTKIYRLGKFFYIGTADKQSKDDGTDIIASKKLRYYRLKLFQEVPGSYSSLSQLSGKKFKNPRLLLDENVKSWAVNVGEPSIIRQNDSVYMYFTGMDATGYDQVIGLAVGKSIESLTVLDNPVVGMGYGGAGPRRAACSYVFRYNGFIYLIATNGMGTGEAWEDREPYLYKSLNGRTFNRVGKIMQKSQVPGASGFGNIAIATDMNDNALLINGKFEVIGEVAYNGIWKMLHYQASAIEDTSAWSYVSELPSLQPVPKNTYGGANLRYVDGKAHLFFHYSTDNGVLPCVLGYATSTDFFTYTLVETPFKDIEVKPWGNLTDQIADAWVVQLDKLYLACTLNYNGSPHHAKIYLWDFEGTR